MIINIIIKYIIIILKNNTVIPIVIGALGTNTKDQAKRIGLVWFGSMAYQRL